MKLCPTCGKEFGDEQKFCPDDGSALRSSQQGDLVGSVIAEKFHIIQKLGEGGMGAVYLGEHVKMKRKSAIKVMSSSMAHDPEAIARFNREATNASHINHPNVCAIYDFGETPDGLIYLAMEFIEGGSLGDVLEREGTLSLQRASAILSQTADALQAAHDLGIVHRDLKPDNIMLTKSRSGGDMVKVVDFGIAKAMSGEEGQQVTKTGLVVGTPEYMSPEQLSGDTLDGRSDVYSLALVFYRMVTGTFPFPAESAQEIMIKRLTDEPLALGASRPDLPIPPALEQAVRHALGRMPSERYATAVEFARDVATAVQGMGAAAAVTPTEAATQILKAEDTDVTAQLAPTRVGRAPTPATPTTPRPSVSPAAPPPKKKSPALAIAAVAVVLVGAGGYAALQVLGGGGNAEVPALDTVPPVVQRDTQPSGGQPSGGQQQPSGGGQQPGPGGTPGNNTPTPPPVDSAALSDELGTLLDRSEDPSVMPRLEEILGNERNPTNLRAEAAAIAATAYFFRDNATRACELIRRAQRLAPTNGTYAQTFQRFGCS